MTDDQGSLLAETETPPEEGPASTQHNWYGIVALISGLLGAMVIAVVFGQLGLRAARDRRATNRPLSLAGAIIGWVEVGAICAALISYGMGVLNQHREAQDAAAGRDVTALYTAMQPVWTATVNEATTMGSTALLWIDQQRVFGPKVNNNVFQFGQHTPLDVLPATVADATSWGLAYDTTNPHLLTCVYISYGSGNKMDVYYDSTVGVTYDKTPGCTR